MTTHNTGNPLGSTDVYDRYDNSENLDNFSNGPLDAYPDRFGVSRQSLQGIRNASQYVILGAYAAGLQFTSLNQVFSYLGEFYAPGPAITLPYTTTGAGAGEIANFRSVGDAVLRGDLANDADQLLGASLVARASIAVASISDLCAIHVGVRRENSRYLLLSFYAGSLQGGGEFVWRAAASRANADGVMIIDPASIGAFNGTPATLSAFFAAQGTGVGSGCWVRVNATALTPETCGAVGDGVEDDATAVAKWWALGVSLPLVARKKYALSSGITTAVVLPADCHFSASGFGAVFDVKQGRAFAFYIEANAGVSIEVKDFDILGNDKASNGIYVNPQAGTWVAERISITGCNITSIKGLTAGYWSSAVNGISVNAPAKLVVVADNIVDGVTRDYVNPGFVSSIGVSVLKVVGIARITGNTIANVQSPSGDIDADGVVVFGRDVALDVSQDVAVYVSWNYVKECKGRSVKLQTTNAYVTNNRFENRVSNITDTSCCIDAQFGGVSVVGNYWDLGAVGGASPGADVTFVQAQHQATARKESRVLVADNFIALDREIRYFVFEPVVSGNTIHSDVRNNTVKAVSSAGFINNEFYRQSGTINNFTKMYISVENNTYPSKTDTYMMLDQTISSNQPAGDVIEFSLVNNKNTRTATVFTNYAVITNNGSLPYFGKMRVSGNTSLGSTSPNRINCTSLPIGNVLGGSNFYLNTGTLAGAPTGFTGTVQVESEGGATRLTGTNVAHRATPSSGWRLTTTTAI